MERHATQAAGPSPRIVAAMLLVAAVILVAGAILAAATDGSRVERGSDQGHSGWTARLPGAILGS
jgi:hypothetical protein